MYYTCPFCGAHLDNISEKCDCGDIDDNANLPKQEEESDAVDQFYKDWYAC